MIHDVLLSRAIALTAALLFLAACSDSEQTPWPSAAPKKDPETERFVEQILERMSLEQKIGQIIQAEIQHVSPDEVGKYGLGSVLNGGGSFPGLDRRATIGQWTALAAEFQQASRQPMREGLPAIPVLWGTDAVHGHNNVFGATIYPHNIALGATGNATLVEAIGSATAADVAATGIDWNFAPTLAVSRDLRWGRAYESFSSDPDLVTQLGRAAIVGLQGRPGQDWLGRGKVIATAKHFVGDGGTHEGIDQGDTRLEEDELAAIHGLPYGAALEAGAQTVMASFSSWNGRKMHGHRYLLTDVLKNTMGFDGFVIGDWNGHGQIPGCTVTDCLEALEAGVDMFMVPEDWRAFRETLLDHAREGRLPVARLDDAVRRILRVKKRAGLFDGPTEGAAGLPEPEAHAALARRAVRESLVVLKNNGQVLPIDPRHRILVVGDGADDIGKQSGGWTLDWQGVTGTNESFPNGQSIYQGIAEQVAKAGGEVHLGETGAADFGPDVVIAVIGEDPYAEGPGDVTTLEFQSGSREALDMLRRLGALEAPIATVFLSGRPLWVNPELNRSGAFVAAWLPGTEGGGVADVLLAGANGRVQHEPTGRLSFAWPAEPLPNADGEFATLFEFGFGLSYGDVPALETLPEDAMAPRVQSTSEDADVVLFDGSAVAPWRLVLRDAATATLVDASGQIARTSGPAALTITPTDRKVQGDARRVTWPGKTEDAILLFTEEPVDLGALRDRNAAIAFDIRLESGPPHPIGLAIECGASCAGKVSLDDALQNLPSRQWQRVRITLDCFESAGADLSRVSSVFAMSADGPAELSLADLRIEAEGAAGATLDCAR
ncbi:MAG: exo 1,3/1,4-beta-D-glucan glucohydrolase [Wenzhouxiangellaceae bacterium]